MANNVIYLTEDFIPVDKDDPRMAMVKVRQPDGKIVFGFPTGVKQNKVFHQTFEGHAGRPGEIGGSKKRFSDMRASQIFSNPTQNKPRHYSSEGVVKSISINLLVPTQNAILESGLNAYSEGKGSRQNKPIAVIERNGKYVIIDGHHRAALAILNGEKSVEVKVLSDYDLNLKKNNSLFHSGGQGSGDFGHTGRPGQVGGSGEGTLVGAGGLINFTELEIALEELNPFESDLTELDPSERAETMLESYRGFAKSIGVRAPIRALSDEQFNIEAAPSAQRLGLDVEKISGLHRSQSNGSNSRIYLRQSALDGSYYDYGEEDSESAIEEANSTAFHEIGHAYEVLLRGRGLGTAANISDYRTNSAEAFANNFSEAVMDSMIEEDIQLFTSFLEEAK